MPYYDGMFRVGMVFCCCVWLAGMICTGACCWGSGPKMRLLVKAWAYEKCGKDHIRKDNSKWWPPEYLAGPAKKRGFRDLLEGSSNGPTPSNGGASVVAPMHQQTTQVYSTPHQDQGVSPQTVQLTVPHHSSLEIPAYTESPRFEQKKGGGHSPFVTSRSMD